jgi:hypothetical protein
MRQHENEGACGSSRGELCAHPNVDREFARLRRPGYLEGPFEPGSTKTKCINAVLGVAKMDSPDNRCASHVC